MTRLPTCLAAIAITVAALAAASDALAVNWLISDTNGTLRDYTQGGGAAVNPRAITPGFSGSIVSGIDFAPDGTLFLLTTKSDNRLYKINPATATSTVVGPTGLSDGIEGDLGFDPTSGILYGLYNLGAGQQFFTLNTTTGAATIKGTIAGDDPSGLAFDNSGQMWVINSNTNTTNIPTLLKVDKTNGNVLSTQSTGVLTNGSTLGADFNPATNLLYFAADNGNFYRADTATGLATLIGPHGAGTASGLAFAVPEPGSVILLLPAGAALLWISIRRRAGRAFAQG